MALVSNRVYDGAAQDATLPYVDVGEAEIYDWSTKTEGGSDHRIMMHVWSNYEGKKEAYDIIEQIRSTLHEAGLSVTGHTLVILRYESADVFRDIDGKTWHGRVDFKALTQDT